MTEEAKKAEKKDEKEEEDKESAEKAKKSAAKQDKRDVVVHPIVLLSVVDHYNRVAKGTTKRVVGTLLGEVNDYKRHITNCFAVPFEEDPRDPQVWFLDHNFHENMYAMFKKVNAKEQVRGDLTQSHCQTLHCVHLVPHTYGERRCRRVLNVTK
mmetsp:Transcript_13944/g.20596  ORF Transcript_13944/g.20596 Transcript_13944/m.20596 type:complete len:154 (+) Transcript_13944:49-510(+)